MDIKKANIVRNYDKEEIGESHVYPRPNEERSVRKFDNH